MLLSIYDLVLADIKIPNNLAVGFCEPVQADFTAPLQDQEKENRHKNSRTFG